MRSLIVVLTVFGVMGLAYWAYQENYMTQRSLSRVSALQSDITAARSRLGVLRAEWAYQNRPDRLRELAELNFDRLGLLALRPDQFGSANQIAFPSVEPLELDDAIEVSAQEANQ